MSKVAIIFGVGARTGYGIAQKFAREGFKVAVTSRTVTEGVTPEGYLAIKADLAKAELIPSVFQTVKSKLGVPSVVIYNAYANTAPASNPMDLPTDGALDDFKVNTLSAMAVVKEAIVGWETLAADTPKSFIYTGNAQNKIALPIPAILSLGIGKAASAYWIGSAALIYADKGYGFYYADERRADGSPVGGDISGEAHGDFYLELAQGKKGVPALATFVKGKGYVDFSKP